MYEYSRFLFLFFLFVSHLLYFEDVKIQQLIRIFFRVPLTLSPVTGRLLDYTISSVHIGVTDVT